MDTQNPVPDPAAHGMTRYDTDPDALAWARAKVQHYIERIARFEEQATESNSSNKARGLRVARRSAEQTLIGGEGCVVGAFDERRPQMFAGAAPTPADPDRDDASPELITQYGFRLRDSTLLEFDTRAHRDHRMAEFVAVEWQVTPLTRQVRPAQYGEWTEETVSEQGPQRPPHLGGSVYKTVEDVDTFAAAAHHGQVDKIGVPYIEHVRAVAAGLAPFGDDLVIAGLLHDVLEDTDWTAGELRAIGIPARSLAAVEAVTNQAGVPYEEKIQRIIHSADATLVKIADNAHNSRPDRAAQLPPEKRERLAAKYRAARAVLWPAASRADIEAIIRIINPSLLVELGEEPGKTPSPYRALVDGVAAQLHDEDPATYHGDGGPADCKRCAATGGEQA